MANKHIPETMKRPLLILILTMGCTNLSPDHYTLTVDDIMTVYQNGWYAGVNRATYFDGSDNYWKLDSARTRKYYKK